MPTHDRPDVLGFAIRSVLDQTRPDFELLVVGDGCSAETKDVVAGFDDPRIRFFDLPKAPHFGYANRNVALREATGALIAFAADDDLLFPDHLDRLDRALPDGAALAYSQSLWVSTDGVAAPFLTNLEMADELRDFMERRNTIPAGCFVYRADCLPSLDVWPEDVPAAADWRLWQSIIRNNPNSPIGHCRVPTMLHFSAARTASRHSSMPEFAILLEIADSADWWPAALRVAVPRDRPEQAVFADLMRADPEGWVARTCLAAADVAARLAWNDVSEVRPALRRAREEIASLRENATVALADRDRHADEVAVLRASAAAALADRDGHAAAALADRDRHAKEVATIRASTSWRLTQPLRAVAGTLRRLAGRT